MNRLRRHRWPIAGLALLTLLMFGDILLSPKPRVLSAEGADIFLQDVYWRQFAFNELRHGNFPLWNPHIFSGTPFFGGFQSGMLYPLNLHYFIMPVYRAINISIALHVFLVGLFMYLWASWKGLGRTSAFACGVMVMFGGAYFMNVFAGHLGPIGAMAWAPLIFLAIDMIMDKPTTGRVLLGIFAVAMQIVADAPQYVFFTGVAAAIYTGLRWIALPGKKKRALALMAVGAGAVALTAVEVIPCMIATGESTRGGGVSYQFASSFGFPPENLITMISPHFFGNMVDMPYWGRCLLWEMLPSIGLAGLVLAFYGVFRGRRRARSLALFMTVALFVLALGKHTPLYDFVYNYVPGFSGVRGMSKFTFHMVLFLVLLSGAGLDQLLRTRRVPTALIVCVAIAFILLAGVGLHLLLAPSQAVPKWWVDFMEFLSLDDESALKLANLKVGTQLLRAAQTAGGSLLLSAVTLLFMGLILFFGKYSRKVVPALVGLIVLENFAFALSMRPSFPYELTQLNIARVAEGITTNDRTLFPTRPDVAMVTGTHDIWGYGPFFSRRYAEFLGYSQGLTGKQLDGIVQDVPLKKFSPMFRLLRCCYFITEEGGRLFLPWHGEPFPRALIVPRCSVMTTRDEILKELSKDDFDPTRMVILESPPDPMPAGTKGGAAKVTDRTTDDFVVEADTPAPAILLITDVYAKGWRASAMEGGVQQDYRILPADRVLRAIPLKAGHHVIHVEYVPEGLKPGLAISLFAALGLIVTVWLWLRKTASPE